MQKNKRKYIKIKVANSSENEVISIHIAKVTVTIEENTKQGLRQLHICYGIVLVYFVTIVEKKKQGLRLKKEKGNYQLIVPRNNRRKKEARIETIQQEQKVKIEKE